MGTLPLRLMALEYGADLVYTPEVVDKGIVGAERVVNGIQKKRTGSTEVNLNQTRQRIRMLKEYILELYIEDNGTIDYNVKGVSVFRTHPSEKDRLVFQIGSANADLALEAALKV